MIAFLGTLEATLLREMVEQGTWFYVSHGMTVRRVALPDFKRPVHMRRGGQTVYAACQRCGTFGRVGLILAPNVEGQAAEPYCGQACLEEVEA